MSFFDRLFAYRKNDVRTPFEDFLTELFAEWLRSATSAGRISEVLTGLFRLRIDQLGDIRALTDIVWETQHIIGPGHSAAGKRPDIIGRAPDFFLIIESKIDAGFTRYDTALGDLDQLGMYQSYRRERLESHGGLVLITHATLPPFGWKHPTIYWGDVEKFLRKFSTGSSQNHAAGLDYLNNNLIAFLGVNGMNGTRIDLADITAYPAYRRLTDGLTGLGRIAENRLKIELQGAILQQLKAPRGGGGGDFVWPIFCGWTLSNGGFKCHDAQLILWSGTVAEPIYDYIKPFTEGIPDLSVGVGLWFVEELTGEYESYIRTFLDRLNAQSFGKWQLDLHNRDGRGPILLIYIRRSLLDIHVQAAGNDLDDIAGEFFSVNCKALIGELSAFASTTGKSVDQTLFDMVVSESAFSDSVSPIMIES